MWNKKKEEEHPARPVASPAAPANPVKENTPMSSAPMRSYEPESPRGQAVIGKSVMIKGQIYSREDLTIDGEVEGSVELHEHRLTVGPNGTVKAGIKARELIVLGTIHGDVEVTDKIDIRKEAKLVGNIKTARIVIEDGAYFKGSTDIVRPEVGKAPAPVAPVAKPAPAAVPAAAAAAAPATAGDVRR